MINNTNISKFFNQPLFAPRFTKKRQIYFLNSVYELLLQGFSLNQGISFMKLLMKKEKALIDQIESKLSIGIPFEKALEEVGFSFKTVAHLFYAQKQGRFLDSIKENATQLQQTYQYQQHAIKQITYPFVMLLFLVGMLFGMRQFLLPYITGFITPAQYEQNGLLRVLILFFTYLPEIGLGSVAVSIGLFGAIDLYLLRQSYLQRFSILCRFPLIKKWIKWYCTLRFTHELGFFFKSGFSLQQSLAVMIQYPVDPFLTEIATVLNNRLLLGENLSDILKDWEIFTNELSSIIYQGELTSRLGTQCLLYSTKLRNELTEDIQKKIQWLQPILLLIIGILMMSMYLMLMLPMLTMEGF